MGLPTDESTPPLSEENMDEMLRSFTVAVVAVTFVTVASWLRTLPPQGVLRFVLRRTRFARPLPNLRRDPKGFLRRRSPMLLLPWFLLHALPFLGRG